MGKSSQDHRAPRLRDQELHNDNDESSWHMGMRKHHASEAHPHAGVAGFNEAERLRPLAGLKAGVQRGARSLQRAFLRTIPCQEASHCYRV